MADPKRVRDKGENSKSQADAAAQDATVGDRVPVAVTQDPNGNPDAPAKVVGVGQPAAAIGKPTGKLDQDRDGTAETPELGQAHSTSPQSTSPTPPTPGPQMDSPKRNPDSTREDEETGSRTPSPRPRSQARAVRPEEMFNSAIEQIAAGVKKLTEAGMGSAEAGKIAVQVWGHCCQHCEE